MMMVYDQALAIRTYGLLMFKYIVS